MFCLLKRISNNQKKLKNDKIKDMIDKMLLEKISYCRKVCRC